jgi:hypothetical protein
MSGSAGDHWLVRDYLCELDAAMRGLPAAQARELHEQITAHLDDALPPAAGDDEVAATLSRLGSPADLAAEARAASGSTSLRPARTSRWRLAAVIAVPTVIAAVLGGLKISNDMSSYLAAGRLGHLAQLNAAVVTLTQDLEDERDLSAAYVAREHQGPAALARARTATDAAASALRADAPGVGAGYQPGTVQALTALLASVTELGDIRHEVSFAAAPPSQVIQLYTRNVIGPASTFSAALGDGTGDARLQVTVTALAALLGVENELSLQRAIVSAALSARPPVLTPPNLTALEQAIQQQQADLSDFNAVASTAEQQFFSTTVSGMAVDMATAQEDLAEQAAAAQPPTSLTTITGLDAAAWYPNMSTTIGDIRRVTSQLAGQVTARANALKSNAISRLVLTSIVTLVLLVLVLLISATLGRPLTRP